MVCGVNSGFDLHKGIAAAVRDATGACRFVREFAEAYANPVVDGDGCDQDDLGAAEARLGFPLPASLHAVYALIGRRDDLTRVQDHLLAPGQLHLDDTGQVLVFRVENQHGAQWGVPLPALADPDPPAVFRPEVSGSAERLWRPFMDRVSMACVEMVLSEWMLSGEVFADNRELDDQAIDALERGFRRLPLPDYPLWADPDGRPMRWFGGDGVVLRDDAATWLWARAASSEGIARVRQALPGEWLMADDQRGERQ